MKSKNIKEYCNECEKQLNKWEIENNNGYCEDCLLKIELSKNEIGALLIDD